MKRTSLSLARLLKTSLASGGATLYCCSLGQTVADANLIHLDTPSVLTEKALSGRIDLRAFRGREDLTYTSLGLNYGLGNGYEAVLRGSFAPRRTSGLVRHGGSDLEVAVKMRPQGAGTPFAILVGIGLPSTPTQTELVPTAGITASFGNETVSGYLNPRAVFLKNNSLIGIGIGGGAQVGQNLRVVADYTALIAGENTREVATGRRLRRPIYGVALRYNTGANGNLTIDLGYANGTGITTGFGLTPGLDNSGAIFLALTIRS